MGCPIGMEWKAYELKERDMNEYIVGFAIWPLTPPMTFTLEFQVKFYNSYILGMHGSWHIWHILKINLKMFVKAVNDDIRKNIDIHAYISPSRGYPSLQFSQSDLVIPPETKFRGGILDSPCSSVRLSVCLSVRPSVRPWVGVRMITLILFSGFKIFFLHISLGSRSCMGLNISVLPH